MDKFSVDLKLVKTIRVNNLVLSSACIAMSYHLFITHYIGIPPKYTIERFIDELEVGDFLCFLETLQQNQKLVLPLNAASELNDEQIDFALDLYNKLSKIISNLDELDTYFDA